MPKNKGARFYAVAEGRTPGVYGNWSDARQQVDGYSGAQHRAFSNPHEAANWVKHGGDPQYPVPVPGFGAAPKAPTTTTTTTGNNIVIGGASLQNNPK